MRLSILYEDDSILVIDKPAGLVSTESKSEETLSDILYKDYGVSKDTGLVHRLDKDTSGVILAAKTREAFDFLQSEFREKVISKEYLTLVHGLVEKEGIVSASLKRNPKFHTKFVVEEGGREASTRYTPLKSYNLDIEKNFGKLSKRELTSVRASNYGKFTLLLCIPETGRTHQIRVHLKSIGHPIVGDDKYGGRRVSKLDRLWCPRQFLHARKLGFKHPTLGEWMEFESLLPHDLEKVLTLLKET